MAEATPRFPLVPATPFLAAQVRKGPAQAQVVGMPVDVSASFRGGAQFGPDAIRTYSESIESYSPYADRDLEDLDLVDRGNVRVDAPFRLFPHDLDALRAFLAGLRGQARFTLYLAGEHTCTLAFLPREDLQDPNFYLLILDAHLDLRPEYQGSLYSHAAWARRVLEWIGPARMRIAGARSGTREEFRLAREHGLLLPTPEAVRRWVDALPAGARVHLSLDIDVLDLALVPGTGNPEPLGWQVRDLLQVFQDLAQRTVVSADLVEYNPLLDPSGQTGILAAFLVREMLLAFTPTEADVASRGPVDMPFPK